MFLLQQSKPRQKTPCDGVAGAVQDFTGGQSNQSFIGDTVNNFVDTKGSGFNTVLEGGASMFGGGTVAEPGVELHRCRRLRRPGPPIGAMLVFRAYRLQDSPAAAVHDRSYVGHERFADQGHVQLGCIGWLGPTDCRESCCVGSV